MDPTVVSLRGAITILQLVAHVRLPAIASILVRVVAQGASRAALLVSLVVATLQHGVLVVGGLVANSTGKPVRQLYTQRRPLSHRPTALRLILNN